MRNSDDWRDKSDIYVRMPSPSHGFPAFERSNQSGTRALLAALLVGGAGMTTLSFWHHSLRPDFKTSDQPAGSVGNSLTITLDDQYIKPSVRPAKHEAKAVTAHGQTQPIKELRERGQHKRREQTEAMISHPREHAHGESGSAHHQKARTAPAAKIVTGASRFDPFDNRNPLFGHHASPTQIPLVSARAKAIALAEQIRLEALNESLGSARTSDGSTQSLTIDQIEPVVGTGAFASPTPPTDISADFAGSVDEAGDVLPPATIMNRPDNEDVRSKDGLSPSSSNPIPPIEVGHVVAGVQGLTAQESEITNEFRSLLRDEDGLSATPTNPSGQGFTAEKVARSERNSRSIAEANAMRPRQTSRGVEIDVPAFIGDVPAGQLTVLIEGGSIDHPDQLSPGFSVNLRDLVGLMKSRMQPDLYNHIISSEDSDLNVSFDILRSRGISVAFDHKDRLIFKSI